MSEECEHNWIAGNDPTYCNKCGETNTKVFIDTIESQAAELSALRERVKELGEALFDAKQTIRCWHGPEGWEIYEQHSPEMKRLNSVLLSTRREEG